MSDDKSPGLDLENVKAEIKKALKAYRCQFTADRDLGDGLALVDVFSPGPTIEEGQEEIELLADAIISGLEDSGCLAPVSGGDLRAALAASTPAAGLKSLAEIVGATHEQA